MSMLIFALWAMMQQPPTNVTARTASVSLVEVRWALEDSGFTLATDCDPPAPKDSPWMCMKPGDKVWQGHCDDPRTIDILPHVGNQLYFDASVAHKSGIKYWCVVAVEGDKP